jgi:PAS domain S-box-containing protein
MLAGASLYVLRSGRNAVLGQFIASLVFGPSVLLVLAYLFSWTHVRGWFVFNADANVTFGRLPGFLTAVVFCLCGAAMLLLDRRSPGQVRHSELFTSTALIISMLALVGYACGVPSFYQWSSLFGGGGISLQAAILFTLLGCGVLCARPEVGLMRLLLSATPSGTLARRLILLPILLPAATGLLQAAGLQLGIYHPEVAGWLFAFLNIFLLTGAITWSVSLLAQAEAEQRATEAMLQRNNVQLEERVQERTAELSLAEAKFRGLVEQSLVGIYVIQGDRFAYVNPKTAAIFGYTPQEMTSRPLYDFIAPEDRDLVKRNIRKRLEGSSLSIHYHLRGRRKDGAIIQLEAHGGRSDFNGQASVLGALLDVTEKAAADTALRESEERFRLLVENSTELVCEVTLEGRFLYTSPTYKTLLGYESADLHGKNVFEHVHPEDVRLLSAKMKEQVGTGTYRYRDKAGAWRWMESSGRQFTASNGEQRAVIVTRDVTERRQLQEQLLQSQKMEAVGTLAGGIAHDFNNILTAVIGNAELLKVEMPNAPLTDECINEVLRASNRARDLVGRILTFSRKQEQKRVVTRLQPVVQEVISLVRASLPATIAIETHIEAACETVVADVTQVHQVVMNLATNAAYAMKENGGRLAISLSRFHADDEFVRSHPALQQGPYVRLDARDTGCGMDAATIKRIFEPFFTTKPVGEGTGLGLSAVHGIMEAHDGLVTVASEPGKGTTFCLFFPAVASEAELNAGSNAHIPKGNGQRVLFVDDEPAITSIAHGMLLRSGYVPTIFNDSAAALAAFSAAPQSFDAVVTDLTMPNMTGVRLCEEIARIKPGTPVILATGYLGANDRLVAGSRQQILPKPFSMENLSRSLQQALAKSSGKESEAKG